MPTIYSYVLSKWILSCYIGGSKSIIYVSIFNNQQFIKLLSF